MRKRTLRLVIELDVSEVPVAQLAQELPHVVRLSSLDSFLIIEQLLEMLQGPADCAWKVMDKKWYSFSES